MPSQQVIRYIRKGGRSNRHRERIVQQRLSWWLTTEYPEVVFFNDWASGAYLTAGQNTERLKLASKHGWVDLFIAEPARGFNGLFIELKREDVSPYLKDGITLRADKQIRKEAAFLIKMRKKGYCALFASGLEAAQKKINWYFDREEPENVSLF